jgi:hypothetical protein
MDLTEADLAYLHSELGSDLAGEDDWQDRYDRLGSLVAVADEVVRGRLADLLADGPGISIPGVFTEQGKADFIKALQAQSARLTGLLAAEAIALEASGAGRVGSGRLVRSDRGR